MCHLILMIPLLVLPIFWLWPLSLAAPVYTVILLLSLAFYNMIFRAMRRPREIGPETLLGRTGEVVEANREVMLIRVQGEIWKAESEQTLRVGDLVRVVDREGLTLRVRQLDNKDHVFHEERMEGFRKKVHLMKDLP